MKVPPSKAERIVQGKAIKEDAKVVFRGNG